MNKTLLSILLVLLVECVSAITAYLKELLHRHMYGRDGHGGYGPDAETEFA